jgi:ATP-dependent Clp protease ATP-binding subunit ClpA
MSRLQEAFADLTGMEFVKQDLYKEASVYLQGLEYRAGPHMRTVLLGSSGSGKTTIVKALAKGLNLNIINLKMSQYSSVQAFQAALADGLFANPTAVIFFDEIDDARPELQKSLNELLEDGEISFVRQGTQEGQLVNSKINIKNNIILAGANGSYNLNQKNAIGFNSKADNISPKDVAAEFLDPKILDRWQNFIFVPSPTQDELKMAVVNGIKNYFIKLQNEKAIYIEVNESALYTWVNKRIDEGGERISYRLVSQFIHENVVIPVSQYLPNFTDVKASKLNKSTGNASKSSKAQFRFELDNEFKFILKPTRMHNAVRVESKNLRCEAIL